MTEREREQHWESLGLGERQFDPELTERLSDRAATIETDDQREIRFHRLLFGTRTRAAVATR